MTRSLEGISSRVERLLRRTKPSFRDEQERFSRMTDGELQLTVIEAVEGVAGPIVTFDAPEAFVEAYVRRFPSVVEAAHRDFVLGAARDHWERQRWLLDHGAHGNLQFVAPENCVQPPRGRWGPGVYATCSCGAKLAILRELVPPEFESLVSPIAEE